MESSCDSVGYQVLASWLLVRHRVYVQTPHDGHHDQLHQIFASDNIQCVMFHSSLLQILQVTVLSNMLVTLYTHGNNGLRKRM
jgi:hypothetical protein